MDRKRLTVSAQTCLVADTRALVIGVHSRQLARQTHGARTVTDFITIQSDTLTAKISPWGAALARLWVAGHETSLVLGLPKADDYQTAPDYSGGIVGPVAGRVSGAETTINGQTYALDANTPPDCLHSGAGCIAFRRWDVIEHGKTAVTLRITLPDGDCGLPGLRTIRAQYDLDGADLTLTITSTTDADTPLNATLHAYWSLDNGGDLSTHRLRLNTTQMCETGPDLIPTGQIVDRRDEDHDFIIEKSPVSGRPLDGCFCLADRESNTLRDVMRLHSETSGVALRVATNQPGLVLYTGEHLTPQTPPKHTPRSAPFSAMAIEAQGWPDAVNKPNFPEIVLKKGATKHQITRFTIVAP